MWNILVTNHLHVLLLKVLSKLYMLPMTTLTLGYIHWAASKGERQYPKSPQRRFVQPQYLFCSQIKSEKGTPTLILVPTGKTHTHIHTTCLMCSGAQLCPTLYSIVISFVGLFSLKGWTNGLFLSVAHEMKTFTALHIVFCKSNQFSQPIHKNSKSVIERAGICRPCIILCTT